MLSLTWFERAHEQKLRSNLFAGLSKIMLSVSKQSFPRIGSLTINDEGLLKLSNRPLSCSLHQIENDGAPSLIPRDLTYATADTYYSDILDCHSQRIRHVPNSINDLDDGQLQVGIIALMHSVSGHFTDRKLRSGPFVLTFTDMHQSNIFVDEEWNITAMIDLEWACVLPLEMLRPPHWLSNKNVDQLTDENLTSYESLHREFVRAVEREETSIARNYSTSPSLTMNKGWRVGNFFYFAALNSFVGMCNLFTDHIQPKFVTKGLNVDENFSRDASAYRTPDSNNFINAKVEDRKKYQDQIRNFFAGALKHAEDGQVESGKDAANISEETDE